MADTRFEVKGDVVQRVVRVRMTGLFDEAAMDAFAEEYKSATDAQDGPHVVLADMRGMKPTSEKAAAALGAAIGYARGRGVVRCAHLSDSTVQRLQARRVARENSPGDDVTIDVVSEQEAERVVTEARAKLRGRGA